MNILQSSMPRSSKHNTRQNCNGDRNLLEAVSVFLRVCSFMDQFCSWSQTFISLLNLSVESNVVSARLLLSETDWKGDGVELSTETSESVVRHVSQDGGTNTAIDHDGTAPHELNRHASIIIWMSYYVQSNWLI